MSDISPTSSSVDLTKAAKEQNIDISKLTAQELKLYKMYGRLPSKKDLFKHKMQERKYFDSGDYALRKAGVIQSEGTSNNNLPVTNPGGLRESIIRRRMSSSGGDSVSRQGSISSGPPPRSPNK
ncbi:hypothetical protein HG536_0D02720 [Torulaspora globosa]|uniref:mRNA stability protein n=1 Tax=Torulaspora globosa TaxID=48254 RepID=A0A7G3ZGW4_9SACH|nr:uncharacterized protein HG536_0D02720 [Torulaspora globosa]QLL32750.1 hypothetical protein HG536_0D02720 [Torulaspora globosa]